MIGHFSAEELASYRAGVMSGGKAARIGAHLSICVRCTGVVSDLIGVSVLLASIPAPPMPDRLAERLQSALAAEAAARAAEAMSATQTQADGAVPADAISGSGPVAVHTPGRPDLPERAPQRRRRWRMPDWSSPLVLRGMAAAAAVVVVVGGGLLLTRTGGGGSPNSAAKSSPLRAAGPSAANVGVAARLRYRHGSQFAYTNLVTSDANFTKSNLPAGVRRAVSSVPPITRNVMPQSTTSSAASGGASPRPTSAAGFQIGQLQACISTVAAGRLVQLAYEARYAGVPAAIIILEPFRKAFDVIVVGLRCGASGNDVIARLAVPQK